MSVFPTGIELFRWGPAPIRLFYTDDFLEGIFADGHFRKAFPGEEWPKGLALYNGGRMVFVNDLKDIEKSGSQLFKKFMLPPEHRAEVFRDWLDDVAAVHAAEVEVGATNLTELSDEQLQSLWRRLHDATINFWTHVTLPELANYGSLPILEAELKKYVPEAELHLAMEILTAPENISFYQKEEMELSETDDLATHQQKYFWLKNSYKNTEILDTNFFEKRKKELPTGIRAEIEEKQRETKQRKLDCQKQYNLPEEVMAMAEAIVAGIEWQDDRKGEIWIYLHYKDVLVNEIARRYGYEKDDLLNFRESEIEKLLSGVNLKEEAVVRRSPFGFLCNKGKVTLLTPQEAREAWDEYSEEKADQEIKSVKGAVASQGTSPLVTGKIRIVLDPHAYGDFPEGDILVAPMTTPEYIFPMKQAAAILTDTGGLTSHAAIVSRELKKPCIVGTKIATKIFRDGDIVEVDTSKGTARLIG